MQVFFITNKLINPWTIESFPTEPSLSTEIAGLFRAGMVAVETKGSIIVSGIFSSFPVGYY